MPVFLSKVFSRGKDKEREKNKDGLKEPASPTSKQSKRTSRASVQSLLEGKFEAVSPSVSPTAQKFEEKESSVKKDKEKEKGGLFRPKSRTTSGNGAARKQEDVPQLTLDLNLPSTRSELKKRDLSVVYEGDSSLDDAVLGEKRLSSAEALKLMRACLSVLTSRGLETLGIMHPHWHSASPVAQRKIISLFLSSLAAAPNTSSTSSPNSAATAFESELEYVRSPHDVAAVFRWALRHLKLDGDAFDKENTPSLAWYDSFTEKEKAAEYPRTAYNDLLLPVVKPSHAELLDSTLSLVSRLASHSEANGVSGSKLSMFLGHYLLTGNKVEGLEDWLAFYSQWERAGRALEHIFLASLRNEESKTGIPRRLSELIVNYPYSKHAVGNQFPRPARFATRAHDALYVRIASESAPGTRPREAAHVPLQVIENALKADVGTDVGKGSDDAELVALWEEVRKTSRATEETNAESTALDKSLANILADESIRILSLKSDGAVKGNPIITMFTPIPEHDALFGTPTANGRAKAANGSTSVSRQTSEETTSSPVAADWSIFSSAGFGETGAGQSLAATLLDTDVEKTEPAKLTPRRSPRKTSRSPRRSSRAAKDAEPTTSLSDASGRFKTAHVSLVKLDESFIDFWSDALLDPISNAWPTFVVCQLKTDAIRTYGDKKVAWLVVEQKFIEPLPSGPPSPVRRASSPRPSVRSESGESRPGVVGRVSATFTSRKRFNFFGSQTPATSTVSGAEKRESKGFTKGIKVNELGEVIPEEKAAPSSSVLKAAPTSEKPKDEAPREDTEKSDVAHVAAALAVGTGVTAVAAGAAADAITPESEEPGAPAQEEQRVEPVKKESADVPVKEADAVPVAASTLEKAVAEEPAVTLSTKQEPAAETHTDNPQVAESAPTPSEAAHGIAPVIEAKSVTPESSPADIAPSPTAVPEDASPVPEAEKTGSTREPIASVGPPSGETEGAAAGAHHGAGESRFVEHIETPLDEKPTGVEPSTEQTVPESLAEPLVTVPETVQEEPIAAESDASVDKSDDLPVASDIAAPGLDTNQATQRATSAVEEPLSAVVQETVTPSVKESAAPADAPPIPVVSKGDESAADEPASQVAEGQAEAVSLVAEEPTAEEYTPIIEEDATPIDEEPAAPSAVEAAPPAGVKEPSAPVDEQSEGAVAVAPSTKDHVDEPDANGGAEPDVLAPSSAEPDLETPAKPTDADTAESIEGKAEEPINAGLTEVDDQSASA